MNKGEDKYVKILTTPESFQKVKEAFEEVDENIYQTCFLLFDECHKIVKDADYRETITLPIDDFFYFAQKAMVSATPLAFTDERFERQRFKILKIVPDSEYRIPLNLLHTNNTLAEIHFRFLQEEGRVCFFVNSTDMVYSLMNQLDILAIAESLDHWIIKAKSLKSVKDFDGAVEITLFILEEIGSRYPSLYGNPQIGDFKELDVICHSADSILKSLLESEDVSVDLKEIVETEKQSLVIRFPFLPIEI